MVGNIVHRNHVLRGTNNIFCIMIYCLNKVLRGWCFWDKNRKFTRNKIRQPWTQQRTGRIWINSKEVLVSWKINNDPDPEKSHQRVVANDEGAWLVGCVSYGSFWKCEPSARWRQSCNEMAGKILWQNWSITHRIDAIVSRSSIIYITPESFTYDII